MNGRLNKRSRFAGLFADSAKSLSEIRTLVTTGLLIAMAVSLRAVSVDVTQDIRITFQFLPICAVGLLFGPVVCMLSAFATDLIGFLFDATGRFYSPQLAAVSVLAGLFYGVLLFGKKTGFAVCAYAAISRIAVVFICNICLNSYVIYKIYVNAGFSIFDRSDYAAFFAWSSLRIGKNLLLLPIDIVLLCVVLPVVFTAYRKSLKGVR
jgi:ECF transporter S component (folate family)